MKNQLLALADAAVSAAQINVANAQASSLAAQALRDAISTLPDDPIPVPTGFRISRTYGNNVDSPVSAELTWQLPEGTTALLEYKGVPSNPNGPQEWTGIQTNAVQGPNGEWATCTIQQRTQQTILFRLRATTANGQSEPAILQFSTPENLPEAIT